MQDQMDIIPQLDQMRLGVDYKFIIKARGFSLLVRPLCVDETIQMTSDVIAELQKVPQKNQTTQYEASMIAKKTLELASTSAPGKGDVKISDYILGRMTPDELQYLYKQWVDGCEVCSPAIEKMTQNEMDDLVEQVKKNRDSILIQLSRSQLCAMVLSSLPVDG